MRTLRFARACLFIQFQGILVFQLMPTAAARLQCASPCPPATYLHACTGGSDDGPLCAPCRNPIPWNALYDDGAAACSFTLCPAGTRAIFPTGNPASYPSSNNSFGSCTACSLALPDNAKWDPQRNDILPLAESACLFRCNTGYYQPSGSTSTCTQCTLPRDALLRGYSVQGPALDSARAVNCAWICPTNTRYDNKESACVAFMAQCEPPPVAIAQECLAGQYMLMDSQTCKQAMGCTACNHARVGVDYYTLGGPSVLSSFASGQCYTKRCAPSTTAGLHLTGCAGASRGSSNTPCANVPLWDGTAASARQFNLRDAVYYVLDVDSFSRCNTQPCLACGRGYFNPICPAVSTRSTLQGACSPCAPLGPNTVWDYPWKRIIADATDCPTQCNAGYYSYSDDSGRGGSASCTTCPDSRTCPSGTFRLNCDERECQPCPSSSGAVSGGFTWIHSSQVNGYGPQACAWQCAPGFFHDLLTGECKTCVRPVCTVWGTYIQAKCLDDSGVSFPPSCEECVVPTNAVVSSAGLRLNDAFSCQFQCPPPFFFHRAKGACSQWTLAPPPGTDCATGHFWGGANSTADNVCLPCPAPPASNANVRWSACGWTCIAGAYHDADARLCLPCQPGSFKNVTGRVPCIACQQTSYQGSTGATACDAVPHNGMRAQDGASMVCNEGFTQSLSDPSDLYLMLPICVSCIQGLSSVQAIRTALNLTAASFLPV